MFKATLAVLLLLSTSPALACSCVLPSGSQSDHVRREFKASEAVFSAYVSGVHYTDVNGQRTRMVKLRVLQVWKGSVPPNSWLDVESDNATGLAGCSYVAENDQALMIYAHGQAQAYKLAACSLTGPLDDATTDIPLLNKLSKRGSKR